MIIDNCSPDNSVINLKAIKNIKQKNHIIDMIFKKNIQRYGKVAIGKNGLVLGFEVSHTNSEGYVNVGCYILQKSSIENFHLNGKFLIEQDYFLKRTKENKVSLFITKTKFIDIGAPEEYIKFRRLMYVKDNDKNFRK